MRTRSFMALTGALGLSTMALTGCSPVRLSPHSAHAAVDVDWSAVERTLGTPLAADQDGTATPASRATICTSPPTASSCGRAWTSAPRSISCYEGMPTDVYGLQEVHHTS